MNWRVVARREVLDASRSRALRAVVGLFAVVGVAAVAVPARTVGDSLTASGALAFLVAPFELVVALTALLAGFGTVAGPRGGGQLALTLGLPIERTALVVGGYVGRSAVVLAGTGVGLIAAVVALVAVHGRLPSAVGGFGLLLALFAVAMTAVAVGLSASTPSRGVAAVGAVGVFVCFEFFWGVVPGAAHLMVEGSLPGAVVPPWIVLLERLQPFGAFEAATDLVLPATETGVRLSAQGAAAAEGGPPGLRDRLAGEPPAYLDPWVGVATLVAWVVVPLAVGTVRFVRADL